MINAEALQENLRDLKANWIISGSSEKAFQRSVKRIEKGETLKFVYHEFSNREPVDRIIEETDSIGQMALPLYGEQLIWVRRT